MQAGEEFGRTKFGDGNSYRSDPKLNMLRWHQTVEFSDLLAYYEGLIRLRKKLPGLCDKTTAAASRISEKKVQREGVVSFRVDNTVENNAGENWKELFVVYNANDTQVTVAMPEGQWTVLADKYDTDCIKEVTEKGQLTVAACSGMMLAKK